MRTFLNSRAETFSLHKKKVPVIKLHHASMRMGLFHCEVSIFFSEADFEVDPSFFDRNIYAYCIGKLSLLTNHAPNFNSTITTSLFLESEVFDFDLNIDSARLG